MLRPSVSLPRLVIVLSTVSLLNDAASEMITPLLPLYLTVVLGAGAMVVGLVEGVAEAAASLLKYQAGRLADQGWSPRGLVRGGYGLSSLARPAIGLCGTWAPVLALRFLDRAGKGIRTSPRDALIAASVPAATRGHAFGFHRAMDHVGSIIGPLLATALLAAGAGLQQVFLLSLVPGLLMMSLLFFGLRDHEAPAAKVDAPRLRWRELDARLRALIVAAGSLALAITPEAFLVLWATQNGMAIALVPLLWSAASVVKSLGRLRRRALVGQCRASAAAHRWLGRPGGRADGTGVAAGRRPPASGSCSSSTRPHSPSVKDPSAR